MERKAKTFFLLLMLVFLMGVLAHLLIPIQFVMNATQKIEQSYNGYKIQVQQNTVRSIAYLNSLAISNQIQIYENVRSSVIRLFQTGNDYENTVVSKVNLNSAYQLANQTYEQLSKQILQHSMWFITGVQSYAEMNDIQKWIMGQYIQFQQYLDAINLKDPFHSGLQSIQITINFQGQQVYFQFPSTIQPKFKNLSTQLLNNDYNLTVLNYKVEKRYQTLIDQKDNFKACSPILDNDIPFAVVCLKLNIQTVMKKLTSVLKVPNFQLSTSRYYLLRPMYRCQNSSFPHIIANFSSDNLDTVNVPNKQSFEELKDNLQTLFSSPQNYLLNVQQLQLTKTYYVTPIQTYNNMNSIQITAYLVVVNDFAKSNIKSASHYKQFFVIMLVPSTILLVIAALAMGFMMKPLFTKLNYYTTQMNDYCHFMHKNDMNLQITEQGQTSDFIQIFKCLKHLNLLNKLSTSNYFKVHESQRIVKLLRAEQLFNQLGYKHDTNKVNIYQNLAHCYQKTGQLQNAVKYMQFSVSCTIAQLGGQEGMQLSMKQQSSTKQKQRNVKQKTSSIRHLRYKIYKLCCLLYEIHIPGDTTNAKHLTKNVDILKTLLKGSLSRQYAYCFILESICSFENGADIYEIQDKLQASAEIIRRIQCSSSKSQKLIPCQVLKSYRYFLKGKLFKSQAKYLQAYQSFVQGLDGVCFDPAIHNKIKQQIQQIMVLCKIKTDQLNNIFSYLNNVNDKQRKNKQFIFISDISNPNLSMTEFGEWKNKARIMGQFIFDNFVNSKDRISITEFCNDLKVVCNLIDKGTSENMLRKQLMSSIKAKNQIVFSQLMPNLKRVIDRTKKLKKQKVYIVFLKQGIQIDSSEIVNQIQQVNNSTFIFLIPEGSRRIYNSQEGFYVVDFQSFEDIDIILGQKVIKKADNIIYLF